MLGLRKYRKEKNITRKAKVDTSGWTLTKLYNFLQQSFAFMGPKYILFDIRNKQQYNSLHIISAINIDCSKLFDKSTDTESIKFQDLSPSKRMKDSYLERKTIIIYHNYQNNDQQNIDEEKKSNDTQNDLKYVTNILSSIFRNTANIWSFEWMNATFNEFQMKYPFLCVATKDENKDEIPEFEDYPNEIIDNKLYLGDANHAKSWDIMENLQITHIINITNTIPNHFMDHKQIEITYLKIEIADASSVNINKLFDQSNQFIDGVMNNNKQKCMVHCQMGVSRSATIVIAYLMHKNKYKYHIARKYVKQRRSCICPNQSFEQQLQEYEKIVLQSNENESNNGTIENLEIENMK